jgi:hypothetical protein
VSFNIPVFISVVNVVAGLIDKLFDVRRDAMAVFLSSNNVVDTFMSATPGAPFAVTSNVQSFSVFSGLSQPHFLQVFQSFWGMAGLLGA